MSRRSSQPGPRAVGSSRQTRQARSGVENTYTNVGSANQYSQVSLYHGNPQTLLMRLISTAPLKLQQKIPMVRSLSVGRTINLPLKAVALGESSILM